jgi:hypothetical protein
MAAPPIPPSNSTSNRPKSGNGGIAPYYTGGGSICPYAS